MKTNRKLNVHAGLGFVFAMVAAVTAPKVLTAAPPVAGEGTAGQGQSAVTAPSIFAERPVAAAGAAGQAPSVNLPPEGSPSAFQDHSDRLSNTGKRREC